MCIYIHIRTKHTSKECSQTITICLERPQTIKMHQHEVCSSAESMCATS